MAHVPNFVIKNKKQELRKMPRLLLDPEIKTRSFLGSHHIQVYRTLLMNV